MTAPPLQSVVRVADEDERESVLRLRHEVYVEEMHLRDYATGSEVRLSDDEDETGRHLIAMVDDEIAGSLRLNLGVDAPFSDECVELHQFEPFLAVVPVERMVFCNWFFVRRRYRGSLVPFQLFTKAVEIGNEAGAELVFCACQPHLIRLYEALGFRSYGRVFNDPEWAVCAPLVLIIDPDHLRSINSPLLEYGLEGRVSNEFTRRAAALLPDTPVVRPGDAAGLDYGNMPDDERPALLHGLGPDELTSVLAHSHVIDLVRGDHLIRAGQVTRTVYLLLSGELDARDGARSVRTMGAGEIVGDVAFVLHHQRTLDVVVRSETACVLGLHEPTLRAMFDSDSRAAAVLLWNLCQVLAARLATAGTR